MDIDEFDKFADEYTAIHARNIRASGETPEFFAEYKIRDMAAALAGQGKPAAILDFGGGIGASVPSLRRYFPDAALICLDVSERSLAIAAETHAGQALFMAFDGKTIPFEARTFDLAFAACVFHHIEHTEHVDLLRKLCRILRDDGSMFVFEHNPLNPLTVHAVNTCVFDENAHLIRATVMADRMRIAGFVNVTIRYRIFFPRIFAALRPLERWMTWVPLGAQYYVQGVAPGRKSRHTA
jgi:ubiquinone/menaquinone biosynthesis C-methylase UbiE